jgi:hypothetical protein
VRHIADYSFRLKRSKSGDGEARRRHRRQDRRRYQLVLAELENVATTGVGKSATRHARVRAPHRRLQFPLEEPEQIFFLFV